MNDGPLNSLSKTQAVIDYLRSRIRSGEIQPGERLIQDLLAEKLGVSATPVREALRRLEAEGLVEYEPYKGVTVRETDSSALRLVSDLRIMIEGYATRIAATLLSDEDLELLRKIHDEMKGLHDSDDLDTFSLASEEWHLTIYRACGHSIIPEIVGRLWAVFPSDTLCTIPERPEACLTEHEEIFRALELRDPDLSAKMMESHIRHAESYVLKYLTLSDSTRRREDAAVQGD